MTGNTRSLKLPHGGTIEIPLPGAGGQMKMRAPSLADAGGVCPHFAGTVIICVVIGGIVGAAAAAFWAGRRR